MSLQPPPPSAEQQLVFLGQLQRLFAEGDFVATYKFSLLIALADLAVELGADNGEELTLTVRQIGQRFIGNYWHHAAPYSAGAVSEVLWQNLGPQQAAVIQAIADFRALVPSATLHTAPQHPNYPALLTLVAQTVSAQPLRYLQNFGGTTVPFLYERERGLVRLLPGVAFNLRRFYTLVQHLARSHWMTHIKGNKRNHAILGSHDDLADFLFTASRQSLLKMGAALAKLDGENCFYCGRRLTESDVDHFIPFALYPRDLAANFVLTHPSCNRSKWHNLAAQPHLARWLDRLARKSDDLTEIGLQTGLGHAPGVMERVAHWSYANALSTAGHAWLAPQHFERVSLSYLKLFGEPLAAIGHVAKST